MPALLRLSDDGHRLCLGSLGLWRLGLAVRRPVMQGESSAACRVRRPARPRHRGDDGDAQGRIGAAGRHPRCRQDCRSLRRDGKPGAQRAARRRGRNQAARRGRGQAARLPRQPAGTGAAPGPHHHLRLRGPQFRQPVLSRGAERSAAGRGRIGSDAAGTRLALLDRSRAKARAGDGRAARRRAGDRPGRGRRVDPALAGPAAGGAGGLAERVGGRHHRHRPPSCRRRAI